MKEIYSIKNSALYLHECIPSLNDFEKNLIIIKEKNHEDIIFDYDTRDVYEGDYILGILDGYTTIKKIM